MPEPTAADRGRAAAVADAVARQSIGGAQEAFYAVGRDEWVSAIAAALAAVRAEARAACARVARDMMNHPVLDDDGRANAFNTSLKIADAIERSGEAADA
jgi:hypothetical protein